MPLHRFPGSSALLALCAVLSVFLGVQRTTLAASSAGWPGFARDQQHSAVSAVASQSLHKIHWSTLVDLTPPSGDEIHYGSPVVTAANTVLVPVKTTNTRFRVDAHMGSDGTLLWSQSTDYLVPNNNSTFLQGMYLALDGNVLMIPAGGGTILARHNPDQSVGSLSRMAFYGISNYEANPQAYQTNVQISTPLTVDSAGNLYFGFVVLGATPINLQSGLARIAAKGTGTWVAATTLSQDPNFNLIAFSCGPALSPDGTKLYVAVSNAQPQNGELLELDSTTLKTLSKAKLTDPASGLDAIVASSSSSSPTVGPDGDVYFGVVENPGNSHNGRGWMLHFDSTLTEVKIPGSFGWDDTGSIVKSSLVSSYQGTSQYLLMTKYNNYINDGGDGKNKLAVLDPNATEVDPINHTTLVMNEVITVLGVTPDPPHKGAVKEWCINTSAVDPFTKSILANSEDGYLYRWDLSTNKLTQRVQISSGYGEAYTPTLIGSDGTGYAINHAILAAIGK